MPSPAATADRIALAITRTFDAPRERVFAAWTDPKQVALWMGPGEMRCEVTALDARAGGSYRLVLHAGAGGARHIARGTYRAVEPPERLVFTWAWEDPETHAAGPETLVTLTLRALGDRTELTLRHEGFESESARDSHQGGWTQCFDKLAKFATQGRV